MSNTSPSAVIRTPSSSGPRTHPVPSIAAWLAGSASRANTVWGGASMRRWADRYSTITVSPITGVTDGDGVEPTYSSVTQDFPVASDRGVAATAHEPTRSASANDDPLGPPQAHHPPGGLGLADANQSVPVGADACGTSDVCSRGSTAPNAGEERSIVESPACCWRPNPATYRSRRTTTARPFDPRPIGSFVSASNSAALGPETTPPTSGCTLVKRGFWREGCRPEPPRPDASRVRPRW